MTKDQETEIMNTIENLRQNVKWKLQLIDERLDMVQEQLDYLIHHVSETTEKLEES